MKNKITFGATIETLRVLLDNINPIEIGDFNFNRNVPVQKDVDAINACDLEVKEKILKIINAEDYSYILADDNGSNCISYDFKMTIGFIFKEYDYDYIVKEYLNDGQIYCERL